MRSADPTRLASRIGRRAASTPASLGHRFARPNLRANPCRRGANSAKSQTRAWLGAGPRNQVEGDRWMRLRALLALGAAAVIGASAAQAQSKQLEIATGGTGGVYYPLGGGFGNILGKELPGVTATARVTGGSVANLQLIGSGKADLCFTQVDAAWDAINGLDKFKSGKLPIRALVVMYPNFMHVVSVEGTGINKVEDMKGRRVSTGSPGSATEVFALRVIEAAGLDKDKDMTRERLGVAAADDAIRDK